ncbi:sensor histidine kinase [Noviherbaspirillum aridicola]|uniref:histidine kinase n=1 Tax=Noviherbaspirillum aridicola TaxID=2849687 RepID=A0ABQ4Q062_9BURK|nr:ATP-binding protein [Noviherbaspirillum aridicola]GIZ50465.1 sensor histidine kinase [Noviherbaspirillum aridicola]
MEVELLRLPVESERHVIAARKHARELAGRIGFGVQDQARIATAVSEIAQNACAHAGGGLVRFIVRGASPQPAELEVIVSDSGPGIARLDEILAAERAQRSGVGIAGAQRLMDRCDVETMPGQGTTVTLAKFLPAGLTPGRDELARIGAGLAELAAPAVYEEDLAQSRELMRTLAELRARQEELMALTRELEDTNRGVVALYAEIEEKAEYLRRADAMKSRFLSNTSHELRTPLSSIRALSQLLLDRIDGELTEAQEKQVLFIQKAATGLAELVNDLLDLAKIEAGKVELKPAEFTVGELFSTLRGMLRPLATSDRVELVFDDRLAQQVLCTDEGKLSQILRNLVSNALKFTEQGEVRVSAATDNTGERIRFEVSDTGIGIAEQNLQLIFEEFSQIENPLQKRVKGTGLGLPLCRKLAELLGGGIDVRSTVGEGSTFSLTIPVRHAVLREAAGQRNA